MTDPNTCQSLTLRQGVIHSFVLRDSKPSSLPPHLLLLLPLSSVDLGLPFDRLPTWTCSPNGQLRACIRHFYVTTVCGHALWGKNDKQMAVEVKWFASFQIKWLVVLFYILTPYTPNQYWTKKGPKSIWYRHNTANSSENLHVQIVGFGLDYIILYLSHEQGNWRTDSFMRWQFKNPSNWSNNKKSPQVARSSWSIMQRLSPNRRIYCRG